MQDIFDLTGKSAMITGADRGIGYAMAEQMGRRGAKVSICSNDAQRVTDAAAKLRQEGIDAFGTCCDVTDDAQLDDLVSTAQADMGSIDILVCNAGIAPHFGPIATASEADYEATMRVNLRSALELCKRVVPGMADRGGGSVILTSSIAGLRGNAKIGIYALSKAALAQLARNLAVEYGPDNVRVNALSPGLTRTEFATPILGNEEGLKRRLLATPLRRVGEPHEIAGAAVFLASPAGAFVTGQNLVIDGGTVISD